MIRQGRRWGYGLLSFLACSCGGGDVRVAAERSVGDDAPADAAYIDSVAVVRIGLRDSQAPLYPIRGGLFLGDTIVIADGGSNTLRYYTPDGALLRTAGGRGQGPGEFLEIDWLCLSGSHLFVFDRGQNRIVEFNLDGSFVRSILLQLPEPFNVGVPVGVLRSGRIVVTAMKFDGRRRGTGIVRAHSPLLMFDSLGGFDRVLTTYEESEMYVEPYGRAGELVSRPPFGKQSAVAVAGRQVAVIDNNTASVHFPLADDSGSRSVDLSQHVHSRRVVREDVREVRERWTARGQAGASSLNLFDRIPVPDLQPYFGWVGPRPLPPLRYMSDGTLWVLLFGGVGPAAPRWITIDDMGGPGKYVVANEELDVLDVSGSMALVVRWSVNEEQFVEVRKIRR